MAYDNWVHNSVLFWIAGSAVNKVAFTAMQVTGYKLVNFSPWLRVLVGVEMFGLFSLGK